MHTMYTVSDLVTLILNKCLKSDLYDLVNNSDPVHFGRKNDLFLLTVPRRCFFCGPFVISVLFLLCFRTRQFIDALRSPVGKWLTYWLSFVMSNCEVVTFPIGILGQVLPQGRRVLSFFRHTLARAQHLPFTPKISGISSTLKIFD